MKLMRYGPKGAEKPAAVGHQGVLRDLSGVLPELNAAALSRASLARLAQLDLASRNAALIDE